MFPHNVCAPDHGSRVNSNERSSLRDGGSTATDALGGGCELSDVLAETCEDTTAVVDGFATPSEQRAQPPERVTPTTLTANAEHVVARRMLKVALEATLLQAELQITDERCPAERSTEHGPGVAQLE